MGGGHIPRGTVSPSARPRHRAEPVNSSVESRRANEHKGPRPNKRLKLTGGDRSSGTGVLFAGAHRLSPDTLGPARAAGVPKSALERARIDARNAKSMPGKSAAVRHNVPWSMISKALWRATAV